MSKKSDDEEGDDVASVVIDNGSLWMRAGFSGQECKLKLKSVVGRVPGSKDSSQVGKLAEVRRRYISQKNSISYLRSSNLISL